MLEKMAVAVLILIGLATVVAHVALFCIPVKWVSHSGGHQCRCYSKGKV